MTGVTSERLDELQALADAATDGPWIAEYSKASGNCVIDAESTNALDSIARTMHARAAADAEFIAAARTAVPELIAALRRVQALVDDDSRHLVRWVDDSHLVDVSELRTALDPATPED